MIDTDDFPVALSTVNPGRSGVGVGDDIVWVGLVLEPIVAMNAKKQIQLSDFSVGIMQDEPGVGFALNHFGGIFRGLQQVQTGSAPVNRHAQDRARVAVAIAGRLQTCDAQSAGANESDVVANLRALGDPSPAACFGLNKRIQSHRFGRVGNLVGRATQCRHA